MDEQFRQSALDRFEMIEAGVGGVELLDQVGDLLREVQQCSGHTEKAFSGHYRAQRLRRLDEPADDACEPNSLACLTRGVVPGCQFWRLAFGRLGRLARHALPQHQTDLGEAVEQRSVGQVEVAGRRRALVASVVVWIEWRWCEPPGVDTILQSQIEDDAIEPFAN